MAEKKAQHIEVSHILKGKIVSVAKLSTEQVAPKGDYIHLSIDNGNAGFMGIYISKDTAQLLRAMLSGIGDSK